MSVSVQYMDQTLREGLRRKLPASALVLMAQELSELPVSVMDIPFAQLQETSKDLSAYQQLLRVQIKASPEEAAAVCRCGLSRVAVTYEHRAGQPLPIGLQDAINKALQLKLKVSLNLKNASALSVEEIVEFLIKLEGAPLDSLLYNDSASLLDPFTTYAAISGLKNRISIPLEFHGCNQYGLATANALSAIQAGAERVGTAVAGIGIPGHAAFEEVLVSAKYLLQQDTELVDQLAARCTAVLSAMDEAAAVDKAIIGDNIFAHESGLHVFGIQKNPQIYEPFPPEAVGLERYLIVGKHSGTTSLQIVLEQKGIQVSSAALQEMLTKIRQAVLAWKRPLRSTEVLELCAVKCYE